MYGGTFNDTKKIHEKCVMVMNNNCRYMGPSVTKQLYVYFC